MGLEYVDIFYAHRPWDKCPARLGRKSRV
jgi:hypothetical protein